MKPFLLHLFSRAFDIFIWFAVIEATKSSPQKATTIDKIIYLSLGVTFAILLLLIAVFVWCYRRMKKKTIERFVQLCLLHCTLSVRHIIKSWRHKTNAKALRKPLSNFVSPGNKYNVVHLSRWQLPRSQYHNSICNFYGNDQRTEVFLSCDGIIKMMNYFL